MATHSDMISLIRQVHLRFAKFISRKFESVTITLPQYMMLMCLKEEGAQKMNELARDLHLSTPAVTNLTDKLEAAGYVKRVPHPEDRRAIIIKLTARGERFANNFREDSLSLLAEVIEDRSPSELKVLEAFYRDLIGRLDAVLR